jgi:hypothetical protein
MATQQENEDRRDEDAENREISRRDPIYVDAETGEKVRIHVVSWVNNTFWRIAIVLAFAAALFAIYDNGRRVDRLESQVCESLAVSRINLDTLDYYKEHPDERADAERNILADIERFHCPHPESPTKTQLRQGLRGIPTNGAIGFFTR